MKAYESVERLAKPEVKPRKFATHKKTHGFEYKLSLRCNIQKAFGLKTMNLFCKMIIRCNPKIMDLITHGLWHCVIGVGNDSDVMRVGEDSSVMGVGENSGHGMVESHLMACRIPT